jgi:hypothetical protein
MYLIHSIQIYSRAIPNKQVPAARGTAPCCAILSLKEHSMSQQAGEAQRSRRAGGTGRDA